MLKDKLALKAVSFFAAISVVQQCHAASENASEIVLEVIDEAARIDNENNTALDVKRADLHRYIWTKTREYYDSNWFVDFVMYLRLLKLFGDTK